MLEKMRTFAKSNFGRAATAGSTLDPKELKLRTCNNWIQLRPTRIRDGRMKKLLLLLLMFVSIVASAQEKVKYQEVNFNNIPRTEFPCAIYETQVQSLGNDSSTYLSIPVDVFSTPRDLSVYCSDRAQKNITQAKNWVISGIVLDAVGGVMLGIAASSVEERTAERLDMLGIISIAAGTIFETVGVVDLISHFQWDYRRKQVDLYLMPNGATLKF